MPALRTAVEMALTAVQSELSSWVISPVPRAFLPSSMTKRVRVMIFVSKAARSVMLEPDAARWEAGADRESAGHGGYAAKGRTAAVECPRRLER